MDATSGAGTAFPSGASGFTLVLVGFVVLDLCSYLSFCPFFFWALHYLSFFDLRILITSLISSNFSFYSGKSILAFVFIKRLYKVVFAFTKTMCY